ncbi:hypothetical protein LTR90_008093 [Exophiala xenobiotica]|nr:hypothetical protein LTR90_008093 [Exophiala xenobiotica]
MKNFVAKGTPEEVSGVAAVTLQAGEQWLDVYKAASQERVTVVGGAARTVGAAGGWLTGGGHSPFANAYGLGVDSKRSIRLLYFPPSNQVMLDLLEATLVNAKGEHLTINQYTDPDYFYAIRGGGGSAWGVLTSVTYQTHPEPSHIQVAFVQVNATSNSSLRPVLERSLGALVNMTDFGYTGYGYLSGAGFTSLFIKPNGTDGQLVKAAAAFYEIGQLQDAAFGMLNFTFPRWIDYCNMFLQDPNIVQNVMDSSRLLTPDMAFNRADEIIDLMLELSEENYPFFNFIGKVSPTERNNTSVHPVWRDSRAVMSFGTNWNDTASDAEKLRKKQLLVDISKRWGRIAGPSGGTYANAANP